MTLSLRLLLVVLLCSFTASAARFGATLQGRILDDKNQPVEFVVVSLLHASDSSLAKTGMSTTDGHYEFTSIDTGSYLISAQQMGTGNAMYGPFQVSDAASSVTVPDIQLIPVAKETKEVEIVAQQPLLVMKPGMLVMNVETSPIKMSGTVLDLIRKAPGVIVDQNGNISLKGKSGVQIYIDGKPTYLGQDQLNQLLKTMPASDVSQIEVITNPSSKYDAEGNSGIINIITKKGARLGFNGNARVGGGYGFVPKVDAGFGMNYGMKNGNFYARYAFGKMQGKETMDIDRLVSWQDTTTRFLQNSITTNENLSHSARIGYDYTPNEKLTLGIQTYGTIIRGSEETANRTDLTLLSLDTGVSVQQKNMGTSSYQHGGIGASYKMILDTLGREITASVDALTYKIGGRTNYATHYYDFSNVEFTSPYFQRDNQATDINILVGKVDYTHPLNKKWKLETGLKSSYVKTNNELRFDVLTNNEWTNDVSRTNTFIYTEQVNAAYLQTAAELGKWQIQAGLRAEQTISDGNSPTLNQQVKASYVQLFPTLFVTQTINEKNQLSYSYSRRINRPDYENLNPFIFYLDQYTYNKGNPFLKPELTNNIEVTHSFMQFVFTTLSYSRTTNTMQDVTQQIDSIGATFQTTINMSTTENLSASIGFPIPIAKWWIAENVLVGYMNKYNTPVFENQLNLTNYAWYAESTQSITLPKDFQLEVSGFFRSKMSWGMFDLKSAGGVNIGLDKSLMKEKLSLSLTLSDIFYTSNTRVDVNFGTQNLELTNGGETRVLWLRARYRFGNDKAARKAQFQSGADELKGRVKNK